MKDKVQQSEPRHLGCFLSRIVVLALFAAAGISSAQEPPPRNVIVPLGEQAKWQVLQYRSLPPHRIRFTDAGLEIAVDNSAMPLIYVLPEGLRVSNIRVKGRVEGSLRVPPERQGEEKFDDYVFRISSDGNDTGSKFTVPVEHIELQGR